ncbi:MAG: hypothetical protein A3F78_04310 [Burkholderiales bacterium RIFCSPLOWO2_12_FULL_61_40]|nr:MAG: hypothetical protein A3F78_04310 [Burkholderiales bacterium RIFCSPLOWO2_12_FULL_61_40]
MSVNVYKPHVLVLPEDDADRQIATGFLLDPSLKPRNIQILTPSGGWGKVLDSFVRDHINGLRKYPHRHLVLLIDFDGKVDERRAKFSEQFPDDVRDRVFLLGTSDEPEPLRKQCGDSYENIGKQLAGECCRDETDLWNHSLLVHNALERLRLNAKVKSILF